AVGAVALHAQQAPAKPADPQSAPKADAPKPPDGKPDHGPPGGPPPAPGQEKSLKDVMKGLNANIKTLATACSSKARDPALAAVSEMERLVLVAKPFEPQNLSDTPEADRAQHVTDFRKDLLGLLKQLADLETEVLDGKFDAATARINGPLIDLRDESHDKYK